MSEVIYGMLAERDCGKKLPLKVLESHAGFYLGTFDEEEGPCTRESVEYWPTREKAERAFAECEWSQRYHL